jgi:hypothetical protein
LAALTAGCSVALRSPHHERFRHLLLDRGASVTATGGTALEVSGLSIEEVGGLAGREGITGYLAVVLVAAHVSFTRRDL